MTGEWFPIEGAPDGLLVDVFYRNTTFTPPIEGILIGASFGRNFWRDSDGRGVPAIYAVAWRPTDARVQRMSSAA